MNNFIRVLRLCLRYRLTVAAAVVCALAIAVLWGGNIGTVYPFVEVIVEGQSMRDWVDNEIREKEKAARELAAEIATLNARLAAATPQQRQAIESKIATKTDQQQKEQKALAHRRWLRPYIHQYTPASPFAALFLVVCVLLIGTLLKDLFLIFSTILTERLCYLGTFNLRKQFYRRTLRMDLASFSESGTSELMSRFTYDMEQMNHGLRTFFGKAVREPLKMITCFAIAAFICWRLLVLSLVVAPIAAFLITKISHSLKRANRRAMEDMSQIYGMLSETFASVKAVKAFTMERYHRRRFHRASKQFFRKAMKIARYSSLVRPATELMGICTISLAILAGAYLVLNKQTHIFGIRLTDEPLEISTLLLFFAMLAGASDPARKLSDVFSRLQRSAAAADRIYQMLDREPAIRDVPNPTPLPTYSREITFCDVNFAYTENNFVLNDINLTIPFGETIAIVGPNGCGKTTLANLIPRFYDPIRGSVSVDGIDLRQVRLRDLRRQLGLVTQETLLFNDSVAANIAYGKEDARPEEIIAAAKRAMAHGFIEEDLDDGYDTVVGEGGGRLSGGQRQRIALARAFLRDPRIMILDEATSQVDLESEQIMVRALAEFVRNRTTVIVTHRLPLLDLANRIIVMEAGRILAVGSHEELLNRCDLYRRLYQMDFRASA